MNQDYESFVGIDWATEAHEICVVEPGGRIVAQRSIEHSGRGVAELIEWLTTLSHGGPERIAVGIEIPRGAVVESLVERGFHVYALNPKQLDRFRDRHSVAGAKDDRRDAYVLGDSLRTDLHCFRQVRIDDPLVIELRELSRIDEDLRGEANRLSNRLREQLLRYFPQALRLVPSADEPWFWDLLELAPTPAQAQRLAAKRVSRTLTKNRIRRWSAPEVLARLQEPALRVADGTTQAATAHIGLLLPRLRLVHSQRLDCVRRIEALLVQLGSEEPVEGERSEHRDVHVLRSFPGVGTVVCATMLAEASQPLADRDYHALRAHSGVAPITRQSGKRMQVLMRHGCNSRLRNALYHWARVSVQHDASSRARYSALRAKGQTHGRALRTVADRLLCVLVAALRAGELYDPLRHRVANVNVEATA